MEGRKPLLYRQWGSSSGGWEYSTSGRETGIVIPPDMGVLTSFTPPLFGLANHDPAW